MRLSTIRSAVAIALYSCVLDATRDRREVEKCLEYTVGKFVKDVLFYNVIHIFDNSKDMVYSTKGNAYKLFVKKGERRDGRAGNPHMVNASNEDWGLYMEFLWTQGACEALE